MIDSNLILRAWWSNKMWYGEEAARLFYNNQSLSKLFHNNAIFMQYSLYCDKNSERIFAGDIVKIINEDLNLTYFICEFGISTRTMNSGYTVDIASFYFKNIESGNKLFPIIDNYLGKHDTAMMEVIGNIYENKDILKIVK